MRKLLDELIYCFRLRREVRVVVIATATRRVQNVLMALDLVLLQTCLAFPGFLILGQLGVAFATVIALVVNMSRWSRLRADSEHVLEQIQNMSARIPFRHQYPRPVGGGEDD